MTRGLALIPAVICVSYYGEEGLAACFSFAPGDPQLSTGICGHSLSALYERPQKNGPLCQFALDLSIGLAQHYCYYYIEYQVLIRFFYHIGTEMYKKILVALDNSPGDQILLPHIEKLAQLLHSKLLLVHVADGWAARHYDELLLKESEEMIQDRRYMEEKASALRLKGLEVATYLALGEPFQEILDVAEKEQCDLIAMTSHGHRFFADLFLGTTIEEVRHRTSLPLLVVSAKMTT